MAPGNFQRGAGRLIALLTAGLVAAACAPSTGAGSEDGDGESVTLTVWSWRTEDTAAYEKIFDVFEDEHPNIKVTFKPFKNTEYNTILQTGLQGEGGPDVAQLRAYGGLQALVQSGALEPLDGKVEGLDDFDPVVLEGATGKEDGKVYGVPFAVQTMQIYYNKQIFAEHGIDVPQTWDQLVAAADRLKQAGIVPFATTGKDAWMLPIVLDTFAAARYGGPEFERAVLAGEKDFTAPEYVAAIDAVRQLQPYFPSDVNGVAYTDSQVLFTTERAAMFPGGSFELGFFQQQNPDLDLGVFSAPPPPGSPADQPLVPGWADGSFGVSAKSQNKEAAFELVSWMASEEFGQLFTDELKQISAVPGVQPSDPLLAEMAQGYATRPTPYLLLVDFRYGEPTGTDLLGAGLQKMLLGQLDPAGVAAELQKGVSQWFTPGS